MEAEIFDSIECFEGVLPKMGPMLESAWRCTTPAILAERSLRGKINLVSNRVGVLTAHDFWVHQCRPRAIYSRLRTHASAPAKDYPRAEFTCRLSDPSTARGMSARVYMDRRMLKSRLRHEGNQYVWNWLRTLATFYTCTNYWDSSRPQCANCHAWLTKKERALLSLNILGRKLNGNRLA